MSLVTLLPPNAIVPRCRIFPSWKTARSVVPAPISTSAVPSSFSSSVRTASALASGSRISSRTLYPARSIDLRRLIAGAEPIADAGVLVDGVLLRDRVEQLAVLRDRLGTRDHIGPIDVALIDLIARD